MPQPPELDLRTWILVILWLSYACGTSPSSGASLSDGNGLCDGCPPDVAEVVSGDSAELGEVVADEGAVSIDGISADGVEAKDLETTPDLEASATDPGPSPEFDTSPSDGSALPKPSPDYPLDDQLRVNHIQAKGTHNSYHIQPADWTIPEWSYTHAPLFEQLELQGVRQIEIDVHYEGEDGFSVFHLPFLDDKSTCAYLKDCLEEVKSWSDIRPGHHLLFILIEPKDEYDSTKIEGHYEELDAEIQAVFPEDRLLVPDDVRGGFDTLREALEAEGWPTLGETRDKVMFVMLDSGEHRDRYLALYPDLKGALIFARGGYGESYGAVLEYGSGEEMAQAVQEGYLLRGNADDLDNSDEENQQMAEAALSKGAHFISTDFADPDGEGFSFNIPGGQPSRCNPLTAPVECTPAHIESLAP